MFILLLLCGFRKYPYLPDESLLEIQKGWGGGLKSQSFKIKV